ncbi:uncharacterized protein HaLaN_27438, partial [Haematococcus lacustris]
HQIPIFSLPQQWLWCESWCGNATKAQAKTIDLCNNPKTKEPKLSAARRIIAEWPALDQQQEEFTASVDMLLAGDVEGTGAHNSGEQCLERQGESACAPGVQQPADVHKQHEELCPYLALSKRAFLNWRLHVHALNGMCLAVARCASPNMPGGDNQKAG